MVECRTPEREVSALKKLPESSAWSVTEKLLTLSFYFSGFSSEIGMVGLHYIGIAFFTTFSTIFQQI